MSVSHVGKRDVNMPSRKPSVLVSDDTHILQMMQHTLEQEGYRVFVAPNGEAVFDMFVVENPDLILLNARMPRRGGCAVCRRIREFSQVPIIMTTTGSDKEYAAGLDACVDGYVVKPFSSRELVARVRAVLHRTKF